MRCNTSQYWIESDKTWFARFKSESHLQRKKTPQGVFFLWRCKFAAQTYPAGKLDMQDTPDGFLACMLPFQNSRVKISGWKPSDKKKPCNCNGYRTFLMPALSRLPLHLPRTGFCTQFQMRRGQSNSCPPTRRSKIPTD